jgi:hypothetical protein
MANILRNRWFNTMADWVFATAAATLAACWANSWRVMARLMDLGVQIPPPLRFRTIMGDAFGMAPAVAAVFGIALALGFGIAALVRRRWPVPTSIAYPLAGGAAITLTLVLMKAAMAITPLAAARDPLGFAMIVAGGMVGGVIFAWFQPKQFQPKKA